MSCATLQNLFRSLAALMGSMNLSPKHSGVITLLSMGLVSECPPVTLSPRRQWPTCRELLLSDPCHHTQLPQQCLHGTGKQRALVRFTGKQGRLRACGKPGRLAHNHRPVSVCFTLLKTKWPPFGRQQDCTSLYLSSCICVELGRPLTLGIPCTRDYDTLFGEYQIQITKSARAECLLASCSCTYTVSTFSNKADG